MGTLMGGGEEYTAIVCLAFNVVPFTLIGVPFAFPFEFASLP
jgi:hypothetical protein